MIGVADGDVRVDDSVAKKDVRVGDSVVEEDTIDLGDNCGVT